MLARADEEFDTLEQEYNDAQQTWYEQLDKAPEKDGIRDATKMPPRPAKTFAPRFKAYAEKHAGEPEAIPALVWLARNGQGPRGKESEAVRALARLRRDHAADPSIKDVLPGLRLLVGRVGQDRLIDLHEHILKVNKDRETIADVTFGLGYLVFPGNRLAGVRRKDAKRSTELFEKTVKDFPDTKAGEKAKRFLFEINNLQLGMQAPDFVGKDIDGRETRLSQYRGQVVMLSFFGFW
jgi:hypothetical protein